MSQINRRQFIGASAALAASALIAPRASAAPAFQMGAQSYCFRNFKFPEPLNLVKEVGLTNIEFCSVHFPPAAGTPEFPGIKEAIERSGVKVLSYGVESFTDNDEANRVKFEFAKALGIEVLTADPAPNSFASLDKLTQEFNIKIAIHNHGPQARYNKAEDTLKAVEKWNPLIGACVDTGHVIRSAEKPHEVLRYLGPRVHSLHLKDWVTGGDEQTLGEGVIDLIEVAKALKDLNFAGPLMLEYELNPENPVPGMKAGLANWMKAVNEVYG